MKRKGHTSSKLRWEGKTFRSKGYGDLVVQEYVSCDEVVVKFINTGNVVTTRSSQITSGQVKDIYAPTVCGVGVVGGIKTQINGLCVPEYRFWHAMLVRCYDEVFQDKNPIYKNCTVSDNFKSYEYFHNWCNFQKGFGNKGWQLDKDLLGNGSIYSEDVCVFVPQRLNSFFKTRGNDTVKDCLEYIKVHAKGRLNSLNSILEENANELDTRVLKFFNFDERMKLFK